VTEAGDSQRLDFDLLIRIESGTSLHTIDFNGFHLGPGDVLWVRAGQVQQWGRIDDVEGPVALFGPHTVDDRTRELIRAQAVRGRSHWPAADLDGSPVEPVLELLRTCAEQTVSEPSALRQAALTHALAMLLIELTLVEPLGSAPALRPTHEAYRWFLDHIEEHFHAWHQVSQYADRLGYSTRTLNRLARQNTGLAAKQLIDDASSSRPSDDSVTPTAPSPRSLSSSASRTPRTSPPTSAGTPEPHRRCSAPRAATVGRPAEGRCSTRLAGVPFPL